MQKRTLLVLAPLIVVALVAGIRYWTAQDSIGITSRTDLDRPLVVGLVSWPGYVGGIVANDGFQKNAESLFYKKYGLLVRFVLIEDIDARGKAFAKGGPDGVDVVWSTVDFWANELPHFVKGGINGKAFLQVDWSKGGDALVADESVKKIEDLKGKKIALVQFTPSHWFLETLLRESGLSVAERQEMRDNLIFTQDVPSARSAFVSGRADAAVVWEPDVQQALKRSGSHMMANSRDYPELIADVMVAKNEFIAAHPGTIEAFVRGWLDGVEIAKRDPDSAARLLLENEPLFEDLGLAAAKESLSWVHWADLQDNARMFGLDGKSPQFDSLFAEAGATWKSLGAIDEVVSAATARETDILRKVYEESIANGG